MISEIIKEKTSADHLLYVSLKYTKTGDVMLNLLARWKSLIELSFDLMIHVLIDTEKISEEPNSPKQKIEFIKKYFKSKPAIQEIIPLYIFFKRVPELPKTREGEFRKNVAIRIKMPTETILINMEKLTEYSEKVDRFINVVKTMS